MYILRLNNNQMVRLNFKEKIQSMSSSRSYNQIFLQFINLRNNKTCSLRRRKRNFPSNAFLEESATMVGNQFVIIRMSQIQWRYGMIVRHSGISARFRERFNHGLIDRRKSDPRGFQPWLINCAHIFAEETRISRIWTEIERDRGTFSDRLHRFLRQIAYFDTVYFVNTFPDMCLGSLTPSLIDSPST